MPEQSIPKEAAYQIINDELMLDGNPRLNLASFVTTWMEPECDKLIHASLNKNYVDMDEYPVTTELQVRRLPLLINLAPSTGRRRRPSRLIDDPWMDGWLPSLESLLRCLLVPAATASPLFLIGPRGGNRTLVFHGPTWRLIWPRIF